MPVEFIEHGSGEAVEVIVSGTLAKEDYDVFAPRFEELVEKHGTINVLFVMRDFGGFELWALWEDIKLEYKHYSDIGRLAMCGETTAQEWMASFCKPFSSAEVRIYSADEVDEARSWVTGAD